jgi:TatD DNase family protein
MYESDGEIIRISSSADGHGNYRLVDTHCHLDGIIKNDGDIPVLAKALMAGGVSAIVDVATFAGGFEERRARASRIEKEVGDLLAENPASDQGSHFAVYLTTGIAPSLEAFAGDEAFMRSGLLAVSDQAASPATVAIGEIGLDYYRDYATRDKQRTLFSEQLHIAEVAGKPFVVHNREADADTLEIIRHYRQPRGVIHCFSSDWDFARACLDLGLYLSFAGNITYRGADTIRETALRAPADRILIETDAPYLSPVPLRGRPNSPANVIHTARFIAALRGNDEREFARTVFMNFEKLFRPRLPVEPPLA